MTRRYLGVWRELLALSWRKVPGLTACMIGAQVVSVVLLAASALALRHAVDATLADDLPGAVIGALCAACAYGATVLANAFRNTLRVLLVEQVGMTDLHERIHMDIATIEGLDHLENSEVQDRVTVVGGAAWGIVDGMWGAVESVFSVLQIVVSLTLLGALSPWLLVLLLFALAPLWCDNRGQRLISRAETDSAEAFRLQQHLFGLVTDASTGKEIRVAGAGPELTRRQVSAWDEAHALRYRARVAAAAWKLAGWTVFTAAFVLGLALVTYRAFHGNGSVGDIVLTITLALHLRQAVHIAVSRAAATAGAGRLIEPFLWLRDHAARERALPGGTVAAPHRLTDALVFDQVSYTYPGTVNAALRNVSVRIPAGSVVAVVGEYGSGKTTLVKLLAKFYRPDQGAIRLDGTALADLETEGWRSRISAAFQDFGRYHTSFAEAVGLGAPEHIEDRERIEEAIRSADAEQVVRRLPDGLDTQLGRRLDGVELSEGQWQKTALARASMRQEPLLFILDEPTASLDAPSERAVFGHYMTRARRLAESTGAITIIVSHRFSTVTGADLILVLDHGELVEAGTHPELMARGGPYAGLYHIQERAYTKAVTEGDALWDPR
ncbi:ABC transporter [Streptomyces viridochromogenes]|uniref:ABC transporter n=1 Tax=Streptomyces viridochromogenes TaxID=1938 RepID=A0A0J7ZII3_STRVR|nr:ABC transporter ATP-binding protein [Streptomyces viridochromogenes]KMS75689.1 ABC transporter [Streptomyces viridochromogenes]KOG08194.1 ABC transporter [Streptomyces viridochromogenes]KOG16890.1 ABC transporter [Streptomyces viridochromogenes]